MRMIAMAIRDRAIDSFGNPFFVVAVGQAIRSFTAEINKSGDNQLYAHPEDFDLYELGEFDTDTGLFVTSTPRQVSVGKDVAVR